MLYVCVYTVHMVKMKTRKTIQVSPETHRALNDFRRKDETFGAAVARLIKERNETIMAWTYDDIRHAFREHNVDNPPLSDIKDVADLIDFDCSRDSEAVEAAVADYIADKEVGE